MNYSENIGKINVGLILLIVIAIPIFSGCQLPQREEKIVVKEYEIIRNVWRSQDGGKEWELKNKVKTKPVISDPEILTIEFDPHNSNNIYLGLLKGGIMKTENGGEDWQFTNFGPEKVYGLEVSPQDSQVIYASGVWKGRGKIFKSDDKGENWKEIYTASANGPFISTLTVDKTNSQIIFATTTDNQIIKSVDGGVTWKNIFSSSGIVTDFSFDEKNSQLIYFLTRDGKIFRSQDKGFSFQDITELADKTEPTGGYQVLEVDPSQGNWVYLAGKSGIKRSKDSGENWEIITTLQNSSTFPVSALSINPQNSNEMIYGAVQASYQTTNGGESWKTFQFDVIKYINMIEYKPGGGGTAFLTFRK